MTGEKFKECAEESRDESALQKIAHNAGDMISDIFVGNRFLSAEERKKEAGYHKTERGEHDPAPRIEKDEGGGAKEVSGSTDRDWSGDRGVTTSTSRRTEPARRVPGWALALGVFSGIGVGACFTCLLLNVTQRKVPD